MRRPSRYLPQNITSFVKRRFIVDNCQEDKNIHKFLFAPANAYEAETVMRSLEDFALQGLPATENLDIIRTTRGDVAKMIEKDIMIFQFFKRYFLNDREAIINAVRYCTCSEEFLDELMKTQNDQDGIIRNSIVRYQTLSSEFMDKWQIMDFNVRNEFQVIPDSEMRNMLTEIPSRFSDLITHQRLSSNLLDYCIPRCITDENVDILIRCQKLSERQIRSIPWFTNLPNLNLLLTYQSLGENFIGEIINLLPEDRVVDGIYYQPLSSALLDRLIRHRGFNLRRYIELAPIPNVEWICTNWLEHVVPHDLVRECLMNVHFDEDFIDRHMKDMHRFRADLAQYQQLSCTFIKKWHKHLDMSTIFRYQAIDRNIINTFYNPLVDCENVQRNTVIFNEIKQYARVKFDNLKWPRNL